MKICIVLANGFEESEFTVPYDLFKRAGFDVDLFTIDVLPTTSSHQLIYQNFKPLSELNKEAYDLLFIPGGKQNHDTLLKSNEISELVRYFAENKKIAAICAAPAVLGNAGVLKDKKYTCYQGFQDEKFGGSFINTYHLKDGNIYTGRSMAASLEFGLMILEDLIGVDATNKIKEDILY